MKRDEFEGAHFERSAYRFWVSEHVRFTDLDALGHVSAVRTNEFFNAARAALFNQAIENWPRSAQLPVLKFSIIQHEREALYPEKLEIGLTIERFGTTSVTAALGVFNDAGCVALARNVFVFIDAQSRLPVQPTEEIKFNFLKLAGPFSQGTI